MNGYNLTDKQKELLRKLVRCVREEGLEQPISASYTFGQRCIQFFDGTTLEYQGDLFGDLDALCDEDLMSFRYNERGNKLYNIKQAGYDAVDNNFGTPLIQESPVIAQPMKEQAETLSIAQIFLCYAREDEDKVENLYQKLSDAGFRPWMAKKDILPGEMWKLSIQQAIRRSDFVVVCLSLTSVNKRSFVQREIKDALDIWREKLESDIYLIPVRLEDCEVPESLDDFQWVNLFEGNGWTRLVKAIQAGMERRKASDDKERAQPVPTPTRRRLVNWEKVGALAQVIGLPIVVIGVLVALGAWLVPNAADFLFAWLFETPTVTPTNGPTYTPVISTATLTNIPPLTATPTSTPIPPTPNWSPTPCKPPVDWQRYLVQRGDTLYSLAQRHNTTVYAIIQANCLTNYAIYMGQFLYLPPLPAAPTPTVTRTPTSTPTPTHTPGPPIPTPIPPTATPKLKGNIAYVMSDGIYVMDADGSNRRRVYEGGVRMSALSPNGNKIAFSRKDGVWLMDVNGSNVQQIVSSDRIHSLAWAPDSRQLVYSEGSGPSGEGYVIEIPHGIPQPLHGWIYDPDWSPDGWLVYYTLQGLVKRQISGGPISVLDSNVDWLEGRPAWSPDSTRIVYSEGADILVINADGSSQTKLTDHPGNDWDPCWSPDGSKIAFITDRDGNNEIYVMNADGSNQMNLTNSAENEWQPTWAP